MTDDAEGSTGFDPWRRASDRPGFIPIDPAVGLPEPPPVPRYRLNRYTGTPDFLTFGPGGLLLPEAADEGPENVALAFFRRFPMLYATPNPKRQLRHVRTQTDTMGMTHVILQQVYGGVEVFGAELGVHLAPGLRITSISGTYHPNPGVRLEPAVSEKDARETVVREIARSRGERQVAPPGGCLTAPLGRAKRGAWSGRRSPEDIRREVRGEVVDRGLCIIPAELSGVPGYTSHLSWRFRTPEADVFVDARSGEPVFAIPNVHTADRIIDDANGASEFPSPWRERELVNGAAQVGNVNPEATAADGFLQTVLTSLEQLGRLSYDGEDSEVVMVVNARLVGAGCPNEYWSSVTHEMCFCTGQVTGDWVAHELMHGVTQTTAGLVYLDEPGALNEHYSDVMAACLFPDANAGWIIGDGTPTTRNMQNPAVGNYANYLRRGGGCTGVWDPVLPQSTCDAGQVHTNSGIGNRAATLLSDGTPGHAPLGRPRLARLFFDTLTTRLRPWSTYRDELDNTWEVARDLAARGQQVADPNLPGGMGGFAGVDQDVTWAFTQVGVDQRLVSGWHSVANWGGSDRGTRTFFPGETLPPGLVVGDVMLVLRALGMDGNPYWEGRAQLSDPGPGSGRVSFDGNLFGARISAHNQGTANKEVEVTWFHEGGLFLAFDIRVYTIPVAAPGGGPAVMLPERTGPFFSETKHHYAFGRGGDGQDTLNAGVQINGTGCVVDQVWLDLLSTDNTVLESKLRGQTASVNEVYGTWGATIETDGTETTNAEAVVNWWFEMGTSCRYRLRYYLRGAGCTM